MGAISVSSPTLPGKIAALADTEYAAQTMDREVRFRRSEKATNAIRSARSARRIAEFPTVPNATNIALDLGR